MHYCIHIITKTLPTKEELEKILAPYDERLCYDVEVDENGEAVKVEDEPELVLFNWDFWLIGGRYAGRLHLKYEDGDDVYKFGFLLSDDKRRTGRLFHSTLLEKIAGNFNVFENYEEKWFDYMMGYDHECDKYYINVDGAKLSDILNRGEISCFGYITPDGTVNTREAWNCKSKEFIENADFDTQYHDALEQYKDCYLTVIDIHK